jgi:predicted metal-binding membrane protein
MSAAFSVLRRERWIIGAALAGTAAVAWVYMIHEARGMNLTGACECLGLQMGGAGSADWPAGSLLPLFLMWSGMMVAMMLPSATPMILTFAGVSRNRRRQQRPYVSVSIFAAGYVAVWTAFSALAAVAQWILHRQALLSPGMASTSAWLGGMLLLAAGVFQFTPLKRTCLTHCRTPLDFIMTRWREGAGGAFRMGVEHGVFCAGCCWALMSLLFVAGVMNLLWIAALTLLVGLEKLLPRGRWLSSVTGVILTAWGTFVIVHGMRGESGSCTECGASFQLAHPTDGKLEACATSPRRGYQRRPRVPATRKGCGGSFGSAVRSRL